MTTRKTKRQENPHTQIVRELLAEQPSELEVVTLWRFPEEDFDEWLSLGMGEADDYAEYLRRLDHAVAEIERQGLSVAYCTASPSRVLGWLNEQRLENTPENRSYAFGILAFSEDLSRSSQDDGLCWKKTSTTEGGQMAKKKAKQNDSDFEKFLWFFATAYLADCVDLLDKTKKLKLAHLGEQYCGEKTWQQLVEESFDIDPTFVKAVYGLCLGRGKTEAQAINFILRGFGCPEPEERMVEVLG